MRRRAIEGLCEEVAVVIPFNNASIKREEAKI